MSAFPISHLYLLRLFPEEAHAVDGLEHQRQARDATAWIALRCLPMLETSCTPLYSYMYTPGCGSNPGNPWEPAMHSVSSPGLRSPAQGFRGICDCRSAGFQTTA